MASITTTFLKTRVSKPTPGKWSSGFSACKKYAIDNGIPFIAVWSNGDKCGHCTLFEEAVMNKKFTTWMTTNKCIFWFGYYGDTSKDDKFEGTGFTWVRNGKLTQYPFVRVYWKPGKVDTYKSGGEWTGDKASGYTTFINKLNSLLKNWKPNEEKPAEPAAPVEPTPPAEDPGCADGNCNVNEDDCNGDCGCNTTEICAKIDALEKRVDAALVELNSINTELVELKKCCNV